MRYISSIFLSFLISCSSHSFSKPGEVSQVSDATVESFETLAVKSFNHIIVEAISNGEDWPLSPALVSFNVLGGDKETRTYNLSQTSNHTESPDKVVSVLIRDGFLDDSVRGDWHRLTLSIESDNTWRVEKIQKASRCWREASDIYRAGPCP